MDIDVNTPNSPAQLAVQIDNPKKEFLNITFDESIVSDVVLRGYAANGADVDLTGDLTATVEGQDDTETAIRDTDANAIELEKITGTISVDFDTLGITTLVISEFESSDATGGEDNSTLITDRSQTIGIQVMEALGEDAADQFEWGDTNQGDVTVTAWAENEATPNYATQAADAQSATVKWYDPAGVSLIPSIERFVDGNDRQIENDASADANDFLGGKVRFIRPDLNLNQIDLTNWTLAVRDTAGNEVQDAASLSTMRVSLAGTRDNDDTAGAVYFVEDTNQLKNASSYTVRVEHGSDNTLNTRSFNSTGFNPPTNDTDRTVYPTVTDSVNASQPLSVVPGTDGDSNGVVDDAISLRPGTETFTFNGRLYDSDGTDREKVASQPIAAVVTAGYLTTGATLTVSGTNTVYRTD
jgi:hypothetical protein